MKYFLGLDNGGSTTKAAIYDEKGIEVSSSSMDTISIHPRVSFVERDMDEMWRANCSVISSVLSKSGIDPSDILCVSICGHGKGLYLWGKDGRPAMNGIISTDNRALKIVEQWKENGIEREARKLSLQDVMPSQPVALLSWLLDRHPEVLENTEYIFEAKDYVRFRLTGKAYAELSDYSGTNLVNLNTKRYDAELLNLFSLKPCLDKLPPLVESTKICGTVTKEASHLTGLKEGTPVAAGAFDIDACAIGSGVINSDNVCMIAGTWSINEYVQSEPVLDGTVKMNSLFALPDLYLIEESSPTSAGNLSWFTKNVLNKSGAYYKEIDRMVENIPSSTFCPVYLPFVMASNVNPNAMGSLIGLDSYHKIDHVAKGIFEGIAFSHRYHYEKLLKARKKKPKCIRLTGGVTNSKIWTKMFANIMNAPIETVRTNEAGALGSAIIASVAVGYYPDYETAVKEMSPISEPIHPDDEDVSIYDKKYSLYLEAIDSLNSFWDALHPSFQLKEDP